MTTNELIYEAPPALGILYLRAALRRRKAPTAQTARPDLSAQVRRVAVDPEGLRLYQEVCGIAATGFLPPTYPQVLAAPLHIGIIAHEAFPLSAMGLVHLENRIVEHRPIAVGALMDVSCAISKWEWDEYLGVRFAIETTVRVQGEVVWESEMWALSRGDRSALKKREGSRPKREPVVGEPAKQALSVIVRVPEDMGRRYGVVSGDINPIHLHKATARLFGLQRPIAHGMWTLARVWGVLADGVKREGLELQGSFKSALYLPSKVVIRAERGPEGLDYYCTSLDGAKVYLKGFAGPLRGSR